MEKNRLDISFSYRFESNAKKVIFQNAHLRCSRRGFTNFEEIVIYEP